MERLFVLKDIFFLLFLSALLSIYMFFNIYVISMDGAFQYIPLARIFTEGRITEGFRHGQQPLFSALVALFSFLAGNIELSGRLVSTIFGIFCLVPFYLLGCEIFGRRVAFFSTLFLLIHPYLRRYSADVLKESTYLFFFSLSLLLSWKIMNRQKFHLYIFIPLLSLVSYLVRPDGVEIIFICAFYLIFFEEDKKKEKLFSLMILIVFSMLFFLPILYKMKELTGILALSKSKGFLFVGITHDRPLERFFFAMKMLNREILTTYHPLYLFLVFLAFFARQGIALKKGEIFLFLSLAIHYVVCFFLIFNFVTLEGGKMEAIAFSSRHTMPFLFTSLFFAAQGFFFAVKKLNGLFHQFCPSINEKVVLSFLLCLCLLFILPKTLKPQRYERLTEKWAGEWIKNQEEKGEILLTDRPRIAYYAGMTFEFFNAKHGKNSVEKNDVIFLVLSDKNTEAFEAKMPSDFKKVKEFTGKDMENIKIYKRNRENTGFSLLP